MLELEFGLFSFESGDHLVLELLERVGRRVEVAGVRLHVLEVSNVGLALELHELLLVLFEFLNLRFLLDETALFLATEFLPLFFELLVSAVLDESVVVGLADVLVNVDLLEGLH